MPRPNTAPANAHMLTVQQVAKIMNVSPMTVYRLLHTFELRGYRIGRSYRVHQGDLNDFLADASTDRGMTA